MQNIRGGLTHFCFDIWAGGPIIEDKVRYYINFLNRQVIHKKISGIMFDNKLMEEKFSGGSCSALALQVAYPILDNWQEKNTSWPHFKDDVINLVDRISSATASEQLDIRSTQAAFNTLIVNSDNLLDESQQKIKALASFHDIKISNSTGNYKIANNKLFENNFNHTLQKLPSGVYLMRSIRPSNNHKKEVSGHTSTYIKREGVELYFEPSHGLFELDEERTMLFKSIYYATGPNNLDLIQIHQLEK